MIRMYIVCRYIGTKAEYLIFPLKVTYKRMKETLITLSKGVQTGPASDLVPVLFGTNPPLFSKNTSSYSAFNKCLDESQV